MRNDRRSCGTAGVTAELTRDCSSHRSARTHRTRCRVTAILLISLLALFPHAPARRCIESNATQIAAEADAASEAHHVPPEILVAVAFEESWLACHPGEHSWGAPVSRTHRHVAGGAFHAASALALGFRRCGTWSRAVHHFRNGRCAGGKLVGYTAEGAMRLAARIRNRHAEVEFARGISPHGF